MHLNSKKTKTKYYLKPNRVIYMYLGHCDGWWDPYFKIKIFIKTTRRV